MFNHDLGIYFIISTKIRRHCIEKNDFYAEKVEYLLFSDFSFTKILGDVKVQSVYTKHAQNVQDLTVSFELLNE